MLEGYEVIREGRTIRVEIDISNSFIIERIKKEMKKAVWEDFYYSNLPVGNTPFDGEKVFDAWCFESTPVCAIGESSKV